MRLRIYGTQRIVVLIVAMRNIVIYLIRFRIWMTVKELGRIIYGQI